MSAPKDEQDLTLPDGVVVQAQPNGSRILQFTEHVQIRVSPDNRIISATPEGWALVVQSDIFTMTNYRLQGDQTDSPAIDGAEFYAPGE